MNLTLSPQLDRRLVRAAVRQMSHRVCWLLRALLLLPIAVGLIAWIATGSLPIDPVALVLLAALTVGAPELAVRRASANAERLQQQITAFHLSPVGFGVQVLAGDQLFYWRGISRVDELDDYLVVVVSKQLHYHVPTGGLNPEQRATLRAILDGRHEVASPYVPGPRTAVRPWPGALAFTAPIDRGLLAAAVRRLVGPRLWVLRGLGVISLLLTLPAFFLSSGPEALGGVVFWLLFALLTGLVLPEYLVRAAARRNLELIGPEATFHFDAQHFARHSEHHLARWTWWTVTGVDEFPGQFVARIDFVRASIAPIPVGGLDGPAIAQLREILLSRGAAAQPAYAPGFPAPGSYPQGLPRVGSHPSYPQA